MGAFQGREKKAVIVDLATSDEDAGSPATRGV